MTVTVEIPDVRAEEVRAFARTRGQELSDFVAAATLAAIDERERGEPDLESVLEEAEQMHAHGVHGATLEEAFSDIRHRFAARS